MTTTIQTVLRDMERLGAHIDWQGVKEYADRKLNPPTTAERRAERLAAEDARHREKALKRVRTANAELAEIDSALRELESASE